MGVCGFLRCTTNSEKNLVKCNEAVGAASAVDKENLVFRPLFFVPSNFFPRSTPRFDVSLVRWAESTATSVKKKGVPEFVVIPVLCSSTMLFYGVCVLFIILLVC